MTKEKDQWGTRIGLVLAMAGNAVGLGNFLRFPVQAVQNGGGAFIIPYLICFLLMGIPLLWIEWSIGRFGGKKGNHSTPFIMDSMGKAKFWKYIGVFGIFTNIAVAAYYCYIESWTMSWVMHTIMGTFRGKSQEEVATFFDSYVDVGVSTTGIPYEAVIFYVLCLLLNTFILSRGLKGVETVSKIAMPLLIIFGLFLAIRGVTMNAGEYGSILPGTEGLNFLWTPDFSSMWDLKVWLAAAGQIFFTLSVGMGTVQCYASYIKSKDDISLNAMSAGWMNEFVEVVIGAAIIIPISVGYFGIDKVQEMVANGGLGLGFRTMPYLFDQWGSVLSVIAGVAFFGLLFFAGITSSLAMGTPWMGFMQDEFNWSRKKSAWSFGLIVLILGIPTVLFFQQGVLDEYDYWAGTVSLVVLALFETIMFSWIFGYHKGWKEINQGADYKPPGIYKYIIGYVTPLILIIVFVGALITPENNDWQGAISGLMAGEGWSFSDGSILRQITMSGLNQAIAAAETEEIRSALVEKRNYTIISRILLMSTFIGICGLVYMAYKRRIKQNRV